MKKQCLVIAIILSLLSSFITVSAEDLAANMILNTNKTGNIYFTGDGAEWDIQYFNNTSSAMSLTAEFEAVGRRSGNTWEKTQNIELSSYGSANTKMKIDLAKEIGVYDIYDLTVVLSDGTNSKELNNEFSYVRTGTRNESFGINTHFGGHYYANTIDKTIPLLNGAGISIVRDDGASWSSYEKEQGVYGFSDGFKDVPDKLRNSGIDLLTILAYGNTLYTDADKSIPETQAEIEAFTNYAADVVGKLKGKHNYFELWNEPNADAFNAGGSGGDVYASLIKSVYPAITTANTDAQLIGISLSGHPTFNYTFINTALKNGAADYMDAVSWHPYAEWGTWLGDGNQTPESFLSGWFRTFKNLCSSYDVNNIWTTEQGWSTAYDNSELQRAKYLVRSYALEMKEGVDKYFWYELINEPVAYSGEEESGWGILRNINYSTPLAAKPAFLATAAMNAKLANTEFEASAETNGLIKYDFKRKDLSKISMIWCEKGTVLQTVDFGETSILKTDMYGNEEVLHSDTGVYEIKATEEPAYYEALLAEESGFRYDYDINSGICSIYGQIESKTAKVPVNIVLYKPNMSHLDAVPEDATNAVSHFNQIVTGEGGYFSFEFIPNGPEGIYHLSLSSMDKDVQAYDLRLMSDLYAEVSIKDKNITDVNEGDSITCNVEVIGTNPITKVYDVHLAFYKEGRLVKVYSKPDEIMNNSYTKLTAIDIEDAPDFDKIKAFVWEQELKPVVNSPEIIK